MKEYLFRIGEESGLYMYFRVSANSPDEAVSVANQEIAQEAESAQVHLRLKIHDAFIDINPGFRVDKSMIVEESTASREVLFRAYSYLKEQGYEYSDEENLWHDDEPQFTKAIYTEDGEGIYALYQVTVRYEFNIDQYSFDIGAVLYPSVAARIVDGEGGLNYVVHFRDRQLYTTLDELALVLEFYEDKFLALMTALRQADPIDGLPLHEHQ